MQRSHVLHCFLDDDEQLVDFSEGSAHALFLRDPTSKQTLI